MPIMGFSKNKETANITRKSHDFPRKNELKTFDCDKSLNFNVEQPKRFNTLYTGPSIKNKFLNEPILTTTMKLR